MIIIPPPKKIFATLLVFSALALNAQNRAHVTLLSAQPFNANILVHGSTAPTTSWFCPDYYTPIDYVSGLGCAAPSAGYSGSWNNYWMNFMRTPAVNCVGYDTVYLDFDLTNSYDAAHPNDKVNFDIWVDGAYQNANINETILFDTLRDCQHYSVGFILTPYTNISGVLFYLNANCGYNDSKTYTVRFDNVEVWAYGSGVSIDETYVNSLKVFPNPADENIQIQIPLNWSECKITLEISDQGGRKVSQTEYDKVNSIHINRQDFTPGIYFIRLKAQGKAPLFSKLLIK